MIWEGKEDVHFAVYHLLQFEGWPGWTGLVGVGPPPVVVVLELDTDTEVEEDGST